MGGATSRPRRDFRGQRTPVALIVGAGSRLAGALLTAFMAVAASTHAANGFFMNWFGAHPAGTEGFEYHLLAIAMAVTVALQGGGPLSVDALIATRVLRAGDPAAPPQR